MGTKVQCESYLLGYPSMRNLNVDSSSSWSPYYEDRALNEHLYNSFMLRPVNEYSGYDKEMLKRTMLEHEAIFRQQVCELHRLYWIQRDLMDELKKKELYKCPVQSGIQQSYLFSPAMAPETTGRIWQMPYMMEVSTSFSKAAVAGVEDVKPSLNLLKDMQSSQISRLNGVSLKDGEPSDSKLESLPKQMLDLRLPADVYIDVEDFDRKEKEDIAKPFCRVRDNNSSKICDIEFENDVKLTLGSREDCRQDSWNSNPIWQSGQSTQRFDYLNEYKKGLGCEGQPDSVSNPFLCVKATPEEFHGHQLPSKSTRSFLLQEFFTDKHRDEGDCSIICNGDRGKAGEEFPSFNSKAGRSAKRLDLFNSGLSSEKCPMLSEASKPKSKKEHSFPHDNCEMQKWFEEKPTLDIGPYQKSSPFVDSNDSELTNSEVPGPFSVIPCSEYKSCEAPMVSTKRKPPPRIITHVPIAVQALPCFPASAMINYRGRKPKGLGRNSTKKLLSGGNLTSHPGVGIEISPSQNGFYQDLWSDSVSATQFKHSSDSSVYEISEGCASQKFPKLRNGVSFSTVLQTGTSEDGKLEESSEDRSWLRTKSFCADPQVEFSVSKDLNQSPEKFPSLQVKEGRKKKRNPNLQGVGTKKILSFPIEDELQQNAICRPANGIKTELSEVGTVVAKVARESNIDLNTMDISTEDEVPHINRKIIHEIDLGVPMTSYEALDALAAENLVVMSLGLTELLAAASCDSLHWFANVVSSEGANNADHDDNDGVDVFEVSTLQLEEMKPDEYLPLPQEPEDQMDDKDPGTISLLLTKTRRGQLRKRRQKDFQKDIFPGLVSLSRHEVTEDLQAFDCLMRAMGEDWQCNLARQTAGRKGSSGQGRGRRRRRNLVVSIMEKRLSPPPMQAESNPTSKVEINERCFMGWGRTTRRGRRPRVRPGNVSLLVS